MIPHGLTDAELNRVSEYFAAEIRACTKQPANPLYHYTTGPAAKSIIEQATFWATNIAFTNDSQEMQHAIDVLRWTIQMGRQQAPRPDLAPLDQAILRILGDVNQSVPLDTWVVSFTERRDSTQHWHTYAGTSHGVALGFRPAELMQAANSRGAYLFPCLYDDRGKLAFMLRLLALLEALYLAKRPAMADETGETWRFVQYVLSHAALFGATMKREDFAHEHEWRLILNARVPSQAGARNVKFFDKQNYTAAYLDLPLGGSEGRMPLAETLVGPSAHIHLTEMSFRILLMKLGYVDAPVNASQSSLRPA